MRRQQSVELRRKRRQPAKPVNIALFITIVFGVVMLTLIITVGRIDGV